MRSLHVGLRVADMERSIAFYTSLGYEVQGEVPVTELGRLVMLKLPDDEFVSVELVHDPDRRPVDHGGLSHLVINVELMRDMTADLAARGIETEPPSSPDGSDDFWTAWVTDPDGVRIELVQWPAGHPPGLTRDDFTAADRGATEG